MRILIVDDELGNREGLQTLLVNEGHVVCMAENVPGAARMLIREDPELLVLDINLGEFEMSGIDLARMMRDDEDWKKIPIIVCSGMPIEEIRKRSSDYAFEGLRCVMVPKPVNVDELLREINRIENHTE